MQSRNADCLGKFPMARLVLLTAGFTAVGIAAAILLAPEAFYASYGISLGHNVNLANELKAPMGLLVSAGLLMLAGQISGIIFIFGMDFFRTESGSMTPFLVVLIALSFLNIGLSFVLKESGLIGVEHERKKRGENL